MMKRTHVWTLGGGVLLLGLVGCSAPPSLQDAAAECGGEPAGISVDDEGVLGYDESQDGTDGAWKCLLTSLIEDKTDQYTITQGLDGGPARDGQFGKYTVVYGSASNRGIQLYIW